MPVNNRSIITLLSILMVGLGFLLWVGYNSENIRQTYFQAKTQDAGASFSANLTPMASLPAPQLHQVTLEVTPLSSPSIPIPPIDTLTPVPLSSSPAALPSLTPALSITPTMDAIEPQIIGYSVEKRPLEVYRFGEGDHHFMIVAGIHGGYEWNTVSLSDKMIKTLKANPNLIPDDRTLYILRVLNPDGYAKAKGPDGRANANNVDLNRNWDADWQANWAGEHCWNYRFLTAGSKPFSEPETQALAKFLTENQIEAVISYHSAGLGIFPGGWPADKKSIKLAYALSQVSPYAYPPVDTGCPFTGQLIDWASEHGIAAVDVELANHIDDDLQINLRILKAFLSVIE